MATPQPGKPARGTTSGQPLPVLFDLLGRRWSLRVLWSLRNSPLGYRAIQRDCADMSSSVLRERLRELVDAKLVDHDEAGMYGLSDRGRGLAPILIALAEWADEWNKDFQPANPTGPGAR